MGERGLEFVTFAYVLRGTLEAKRQFDELLLDLEDTGEVLKVHEKTSRKKLFIKVALDNWDSDDRIPMGQVTNTQLHQLLEESGKNGTNKKEKG